LQIEPGRAIFLPQGAKASQVKAEHPSTGFDKMVWTMIALAGADLGLPLVVLSLDFSQVNFHGGRVAMGMAELALHSWREELASTFIRPSYRQLISAAIRDGRLPFVEGWDEIDIVWPPMPIVDLKAEYEASELGIRNNLTTLDRETRRLGTGQWEEIVAQKGREAEAQKAAGVMPALLPGATDLNAKPEGNAEPAADEQNTA
jgi:capsid protein